MRTKPPPEWLTHVAMLGGGAVWILVSRLLEDLMRLQGWSRLWAWLIGFGIASLWFLATVLVDVYWFERRYNRYQKLMQFLKEEL